MGEAILVVGGIVLGVWGMWTLEQAAKSTEARIIRRVWGRANDEEPFLPTEPEPSEGENEG